MVIKLLPRGKRFARGDRVEGREECNKRVELGDEHLRGCKGRRSSLLLQLWLERHQFELLFLKSEQYLPVYPIPNSSLHVDSITDASAYEEQLQRSSILLADRTGQSV